MTTPEPGTTRSVSDSAGRFTQSAPPREPPLQPQQFGIDEYKSQRLSKLYQRGLRKISLGSLTNNPTP